MRLIGRAEIVEPSHQKSVPFHIRGQGFEISSQNVSTTRGYEQPFI